MSGVPVALIEIERPGRDLELVDAGCGGGSGQLTSFADVEFLDIGRFVVGEDFELPWFQNSGSTNVDLDGTVRIERVMDLFVREDFEVGVLSSSEATAPLTMDSVATLEDVDEVEVLNRLRVGVVNDRGGNTSTAVVDAEFSLSNGDLTAGQIVRVGVLDFSPFRGGAAAGLSVAGLLTLEQSNLATPELEVGVLTGGATGTASGTLDVNGYVSANLLEVGAGGTLTLRVTGPTPASPSSAGSPSQSVVEVGGAQLDGTVVASVDFIPAAGMHQYDLMVGPPGGFAAATPTLELGNIPAGFEVVSYGFVSEGGGDRLRLVISGNPVLEIPTLGRWSLSALVLLLIGVGLVWVRKAG